MEVEGLENAFSMDELCRLQQRVIRIIGITLYFWFVCVCDGADLKSHYTHFTYFMSLLNEDN